jgi:hypothetical protein
VYVVVVLLPVGCERLNTHKTLSNEISVGLTGQSAVFHSLITRRPPSSTRLHLRRRYFIQQLLIVLVSRCAPYF